MIPRDDYSGSTYNGEAIDIIRKMSHMPGLNDFPGSDVEVVSEALCKAYNRARHDMIKVIQDVKGICAEEHKEVLEYILDRMDDDKYKPRLDFHKIKLP